jgi:two-component system, NtrC family, sensor kinase
MRLSISAKIFVGFLVVLATFAAVEIYGLYTMRRLGDELRLVSRGYLELRLGVSELQTRHSNFLEVLADQLQKQEKPPHLVKLAIDNARRSRLTQQMPAVLAQVRDLEALRSSPEEHALLHQIRTRLERIEGAFRSDEELFDEVYGPIGADATLRENPEARRAAAERLLRREEQIKLDLRNVSGQLYVRAQAASIRMEEEESRSYWGTLFGLVMAVVVGLVVTAVVVRALRPLSRLAETAKQIARGDYKERADETSPDEVGALGREFNAMAAALDEREQRLVRSERLAAVGKIAAQITHEVRNPLSSIGLNAEMLEEEVGALEGPPAQVEEARQLVRAIVKEVDRLTEITEQYLRFARLPRPKLEREDLRQIVASLCAFLRQEMDGRGVTVEVEAPADLPLVAADEHQLRQALLNLLRNAVEAMAGGGRLLLAMSSDAKLVTLRIRDSGQGIAAEHLAKVFDPFFSTKEHGTGLGLALTQQIVVEHGGSIDVESTPGQGTTFTVRLPAAPGEPQPAVASALAHEGAAE